MPLTEDEFVEEVQGSGVLVYLSATWLRELYQQVLVHDLLKDVPNAEHPLMHLLSGNTPLLINLLFTADRKVTDWDFPTRNTKIMKICNLVNSVAK